MGLNNIVLAFVVAQIGLVALLFARRSRAPRYRGALVTLILALVLTACLFLPANVGESLPLLLVGRVSLLHLATLGLVAAYGALLIQDTTAKKPILRLREGWLGLMGVWAGAFLLALIVEAQPLLGWREWGDVTPPLATWAMFGGLLASGMLLVSVCAYTFSIAPMPEAANRSAYWLMTTNGIYGAAVLLLSGTDTLTALGLLALTASMGALIWACLYHRVLDLRQTFFDSLNELGMTFATWSLVFGAFYIIDRADLEQSPSATLGLGLLALFVALLLLPARQILRAVLDAFVKRPVPNLAEATAEYSRSVALAPNLEEVINATNTMLCNMMRVQRSALILINTTWRKQDMVELIVLESGSTIEKPTRSGALSKKSPIYQSLAVDKVPLGLFDIEYGIAYQSVIAPERAFFWSIGMQAFVPIVADGRLIGLLACGRKQDDSPYTRRDMELMTVIGQQVGSALRNARLIDDLYHLNNSMRELNKRLENAKLELEKMDSIKTDFVTIASHELRTPLAQIRGYTDILDSLNDSGALQKGQANQLVQSLRKSTERMEELISAMLDVSQLDVNSMDLRFVRTTPEIVIRLALEPLRDAFEQRKQSLQRVGLQGLPHIQADMQRLVQAFRNIIINAIKYTPDGGSIEISARLEPATSPDKKETILFSFKDTGIGINAKDHFLIFQKFYRGFDTQLHSTGMTKFLGAGPGLGLTIAKGIIEGHGGEIWVESAGQNLETFPGTTFHVRLPILPTEGQRVALPYDEVPEDRRKTSAQPLFSPEQVAEARAKDEVTRALQPASGTDGGLKTPNPDADGGLKTPNPDE